MTEREREREKQEKPSRHTTTAVPCALLLVYTADGAKLSSDRGAALARARAIVSSREQ